MPWRPLSDRLIGELKKPAKVATAIYQPFEKPKSQNAMVVEAVGPDVKEIKPGDTVVFVRDLGIGIKLLDDDGKVIERYSIREMYVDLVVT